MAVGSGPSFSGEATEDITVRYRWSDVEDDYDDFLGNDDEEYYASLSVSVVRLSSTRFRLANVCYLTPFGTYGPHLDLGTVIEVEVLDDGTYGYRGIIEKAQIYGVVVGTFWGRFLDSPEAKGLLDELTATGVAWDGMAGNINIQVPSDGSVERLPNDVKAIVDRLVEGGERHNRATGNVAGNASVGRARAEPPVASGPTVNLERVRDESVPPPSQSTPPG